MALRISQFMLQTRDKFNVTCQLGKFSKVNYLSSLKCWKCPDFYLFVLVRKLKTAQNSCWLNLPIISLLSVSTSFAGLAIFSKYARCDPFASCKISKSDQVMCFFVCAFFFHVCVFF